MSGIPVDGRGFARMIWDTALRPAEAARTLFAHDYPRRALWMGLVLVSVVSALLAAGLQALVPAPDLPEGSEAVEPMMFSPMAYVLLLGGSLVLSAVAFHFTGRALGGAGRMVDALAAMIWLQVMLIALQIGQAIVTFALPPLGLVAGIVSLVIGLRSTIYFLREMHHFDGMGRAILTFFLAILALGIVLFVVMSAAS